jgi:hypothetical protein
MWFISFVFGAAIFISLLLCGLVSYLERAAVAQAHATALTAFVPLPPPRPPLPPKVQAAKIEVEIVREPREGDSVPKGRRKPSQVSGRPTW